MKWKQSTIGESLSVIKNGINCEQNKIPVGDRITRIETISKQIVDFQRVGYSNLTSIEKEKSKIKKGDILFSHINSPIHVGKTAIYKSDEDLYHGINLLLLRTIDEVDPYFFNYFLNNLFVSGYWEKNCKKAVNQASVNQKDIAKVAFSYPNLATQRKIVSILDESFAEIDKAILATESNAKNADALFESYLAKVFQTDSENWESFPIKALGKVITGSTPKTSEKENYGDFIPFVKPGDFNVDGTINVEKQKLSEIGMGKSRVIDENSVLMVCIGATIGKCGYNDVKVVSNQQINALIPIKTFNNKFIYFQMLTKEFQNKVMKYSGQATLPIINKSKWESLTLRFPSFEHQVDIVIRIENLRYETDILKTALLKKLQELFLLRNSILYQALKGELIKD